MAKERCDFCRERARFAYYVGEDTRSPMCALHLTVLYLGLRLDWRD